MRRRALVLVGLLLLAGTAQAHPSEVSEVDPSGQARVTVIAHGDERGTTFAFELADTEGDPILGEAWTELTDAETGEIVERQVLTPDEEGVYRLTVDFDPSRPWTLSIIHGYGFEVTHALLEEASMAQRGPGTEVFTEPIYPLHPDAPAELNLWGYVAYGVLLAGALAGVVAILRRLDEVQIGGPA